MPEDYIDYHDGHMSSLVFIFTCLFLALSTAVNFCSLYQIMNITTLSRGVHSKIKERTVESLWITYQKCGTPDVVRNFILQLCQYL